MRDVWQSCCEAAHSVSNSSLLSGYAAFPGQRFATRNPNGAIDYAEIQRQVEETLAASYNETDLLEHDEVYLNEL